LTGVPQPPVDPAPARREVTQLLKEWHDGDGRALEKLTPLVYSELRLIARRQMRREAPGHALQTTALVHEAYLRLVDAAEVDWKDRSHFYAIASRVMRRVLVDMARKRDRAKRGGGAQQVELADHLLQTEGADVSLLDLDRVLEDLAHVDERKAKVVELRFFGGLSAEETGAALGVSRDTVLRDWRVAKLWLLRELSASQTERAKDGDGKDAG